MLTKRRLSEEDEDHRSATSPDGKKRKKLDPQQQMTNLYEFIRRYKREDGSEICEPFIRAPKRRNDPGFYEVVSSPMDLLRIQQKIKTEEYDSLDTLKEDFILMINNWLGYYPPGSEEFKHAEELRELFNKALETVEAGENPFTTLGSREGSGDLAQLIEEYFSSIASATDEDNQQRSISDVFRLLPSKKLYPGYYQVIKEPIDLKMIATKIQDNSYESLSDLEEDFTLMCKNAMTFNEPGSQIYRDAKTLLKISKTKKSELETYRVNRDKRGSIRPITRRQPMKKQFTSIEIANLEYVEEEEEDEEDDDSYSDEESDTDEDEDDEVFEGPLGDLYNYIRNYEVGGIVTCEPFLMLPSKKQFPDYYQTILEPISLNIIRKKLKRKEYNKLDDLVHDMNTMFENCKAYNRSDSQIYKEGVKLQKLMLSKSEELSNEGVRKNGVEETLNIPLLINSSSQNIVALKNMRLIYNTILSYKDEEGVQLVSVFMDKPSKKDYPDYYDIIEHPMDMNTINNKIKNGAYKNEEEFLQDMKLMFANCKKYNEEGSDIYKDAVTLERVLIAKGRELGLSAGLGRGRPTKKKLLTSDGTAVKMKALFDALRDYKDSKGRQLSLIFLRLPNQREFADYYEVIKRPIDFEKISNKIKQNIYESLEDALADFILMFDNACKYNEPDSQIYKDALTLQSLALKVAREMTETVSSITDVSMRAQEILSTLFIAVYNHQDENKRRFSDSMTELPEFEIKNIDGKETKSRALCLDVIKRRLDRGLYKRLDLLQRDVFSVLERARNLSTVDSRIFEDSIELQSFFIKTRDDLCERGALLKSKALLFNQSQLEYSVAALKALKSTNEQKVLGGATSQEDDEDVEEEDAKIINGVSSSMTLFNSQEYRVGDFVYVSSTEMNNQQIFQIEKIYHGKVGPESFRGNKFFHPVETYHVPSRKFLEREVFRSDVHVDVLFQDIVGKCAVLNVKDYFRSKPEGFSDENVYVCESRYATRVRSFKKLKSSSEFSKRYVKLEMRDRPLEPRRIPSVFKQKIEKLKEELEEMEIMEKTVENPTPPNILWNPIPAEYPIPQQLDEGITYFEQYTIPGPLTLKRGDTVYVRAENGKNLIVQIDTMWTTADGMAYFHGPWFVTPSETPQNPSQSFYKQEVFLSTISDINPLLSAVGKCTVLEVGDYTTSRPTEVSECDVYVCESIFDEAKRAVRGLLPPTGLKKYIYPSSHIVEEEIYYFKKPIHIEKVPDKTAAPVTPTPKLTVPNNFDLDTEDSLDAPPSIGSTSAMENYSTPLQKKGKGPSKKVVTAYILYSSEARKQVVETHKDCTFGQISRIVGDKWKQLTESDKQVYEERAKKINKENEIKFLQEQREFEERRRIEMMNGGTTAPISIAHNGGLPIHNSMPSTPVTSKNALSMISINSSNQTTPQRILNGASPSPSPGPPVLPSAKVVEPIFHTVPPRPQKLLHSEAYIKYIEGLTTESHTMSNWERQLQATKENTKTDEAQLPAHWLSDNGQHGTSLDALWALREFMMTDSLGLYKL